MKYLAFIAAMVIGYVVIQADQPIIGGLILAAGVAVIAIWPKSK